MEIKMRDLRLGNKLILLVEIVSLAWIVVSYFLPEKTVYELSGEGLETVRDANGADAYYYGEELSLYPGVYQIRLLGYPAPGQSVSAEIVNYEGNSGAIRGNRVTMRGEQSNLSFEVYVWEPVDSAYLLLGFQQGTDPSVLLRAEVVRTHYGGRVLFFCVLLICFIFQVLRYIREQIMKGKIPRDRQVALWVLLLCAGISYFPYLTDYLSFTYDSVFHLTRIEGLANTLLSGGQFPVRIQSFWLADHGYPVSLFYGDLFLYIPAFFRIIGFPIITAYKMFALIVILAAAAITFYSLNRCTKNTYAALMGSVLYLMSPYWLYNIYNRMAVGEYLGMSFR
jgi:hypothetical protein